MSRLIYDDHICSSSSRCLKKTKSIFTQTNKTFVAAAAAAPSKCVTSGGGARFQIYCRIFNLVFQS